MLYELVVVDPEGAARQILAALLAAFIGHAISPSSRSRPATFDLPSVEDMSNARMQKRMLRLRR